MLTYQILILDDEQIVRSSLQRLLQRKEWQITTVATGAKAKDILKRQAVDLAIVDYKLGDTNGIEMIDYIQENSPQTTVIMLTAYGNVNLAVEAIKKGAYDFLQKEGDPQLMVHIVERALETVRLRKEVQQLKDERVRRGLQKCLIAESPQMKEVLKTIDEYAKTNATVLIEGETGTGKSLLAEYVHFSGDRHNGPFVTINCGAIPRELIESELFGYEQGAFTGARSQGKIGLIKRADGGTLFLDEIGDLAYELQSKLLYVLEKGEFLGVGAVEPTQIDVRFIAATNASLKKKMLDREFRRDLYYRLNVANVTVPPLRERRPDILAFARYFVDSFNRKLGKTVTGFSSEAETFLENYPWPGNARELRNAVERVMLLKKDRVIQMDDFSFLKDHNGQFFEANRCHLEVQFDSSENAINEMTKQLIQCAWEISEHNQTRAASLLGIPRTTLQTYLQKFNLG